jgi:hypothetical protein
MQFLITDLGLEDLILGYPWLVAFEPQFKWTNVVIDTKYLPIVIRSLDWKSLQIKPIISHIDTSLNRITTEPLSDVEKDQIVQELTEQGHRSTNISTQLAQNVQQYVKEVPIPPEY